jgi:hypothetical protein
MTKMNSLRAMYTTVLESFERSGSGLGGSSEGERMQQFLSPGYYPCGPNVLDADSSTINPGHKHRKILTYMHYLFEGKPVAEWCTRMSAKTMRDGEDYFGGATGAAGGAAGGGAAGGAAADSAFSDSPMPVAGVPFGGAKFNTPGQHPLPAPHPSHPPDQQQPQQQAGGGLQAAASTAASAPAALVAPRAPTATAAAPTTTTAKPKTKRYTEEEARTRMIMLQEEEARAADKNAKAAIYMAIPSTDMTVEQVAKKQKLMARLEEDLDL